MFSVLSRSDNIVWGCWASRHSTPLLCCSGHCYIVLLVLLPCHYIVLLPCHHPTVIYSYQPPALSPGWVRGPLVSRTRCRHKIESTQMIQFKHWCRSLLDKLYQKFKRPPSIQNNREMRFSYKQTHLLILVFLLLLILIRINNKITKCFNSNIICSCLLMNLAPNIFPRILESWCMQGQLGFWIPERNQ